MKTTNRVCTFTNIPTNTTFTAQQDRRLSQGRRKEDCIQEQLYTKLEPICRTFLRELLDTFLFLTKGKQSNIKEFIKHRPKLLQNMHKKIDLSKYSKMEAVFIVETLQRFAEKQKETLRACNHKKD
jgi:hypothetical protein